MTALILYHYQMSGSSQKLRLVLAEKKLAWESRIVDLLAGEQHTSHYRQINPAGFVPTLFHGDVRLTEVAAIVEYLDDVFPDFALRPATPVGRHEMRCWIKFVDETVHPANGFLSYAIAGRTRLLNQSAEKLSAYLAAIPNLRDRRLRRLAVERGIDAEEFGDAILIHDRLLNRMELSLLDREFLAGHAASLADFAVLPYVRRLAHLGLGKLIDAGNRPAVKQWLLRMMTRPSYKEAVMDFLPSGIRDDDPTDNVVALAAAISCLSSRDTDRWVDSKPAENHGDHYA